MGARRRVGAAGSVAWAIAVLSLGSLAVDNIKSDKVPSYGRVCDEDDTLYTLAQENKEIRGCCADYEYTVANLEVNSQEGNFVSLAPLLKCLTLPPAELTQPCYQQLEATAAACFTELTMAFDFYNETGVFDSALLFANGTTPVDELNSTFPPPDQLQDMWLNYMPTGRLRLQELGGTGDISARCCTELTKLLKERCLCEEKPMSFLDNKLMKGGLNITAYIESGGLVLAELGCAVAAAHLEVYPNCVEG